MKQWSILSNVINYAKYDRHPKNFYTLNIRQDKNYRQEKSLEDVIRKRKYKC